MGENVVQFVLHSDVTDGSDVAVSKDIQTVDKPEIEDEAGWTENLTFLFISLRNDMASHFEKPKVKKNQLWNKISSQMNEKAGCAMTGESCKKKWDNMKATYFNRKKKKSASGAGKQRAWPFESLLQSFFEKKVAVNPDPELLSDSIVGETTTTSTLDDQFGCSSTKTSPASPRDLFYDSDSSEIPTKKRRGGPPAWVEELKEQKLVDRQQIFKKMEKVEEKRMQKIEEIENKKMDQAAAFEEKRLDLLQQILKKLP